MNKKIIGGITLLVLTPIWIGFLVLATGDNHGGFFIFLLFAPIILAILLISWSKFSKTTVVVKNDNQTLATVGRVVKTFFFGFSLIVGLMIISDFSGWLLAIKSLEKDTIAFTIMGLIALFYSFKK